MSTEVQGSLLASLPLVEGFATRFHAGLDQKLDGEVTLSSPEIVQRAAAEITQEATSGALLGRTAWTIEGKECSGCFLWMGAADLVIGGDGQAIGSLGDGDVSTLDQSLRLNVEEAADEDLPLEWSALEKLDHEGVASVLSELGVPASCEACTFTIQAAEQEMRFLFLIAASEVPTEEETRVATEAQAAVAPSASTSSASGSGQAATVSSSSLENLQHLLDVRLPLTVRLGSTRMRLDELLRVSTGTILELDEHENQPLEVLANGRVIARGEVVVVDERFGLRITEIGSSKERLSGSL